MPPPLPGTKNAPTPSPEQFEEWSGGKPWEAVWGLDRANGAVLSLQSQGGGYLWQPWYFIFRMPETVRAQLERRILEAATDEERDKASREHQRQYYAYKLKQETPDASCPTGWEKTYVPASAEAMLLRAQAAEVSRKADKRHRGTLPESQWEKQERENARRRKSQGLAQYKKSLSEMVSDGLAMGATEVPVETLDLLGELKKPRKPRRKKI